MVDYAVDLDVPADALHRVEAGSSGQGQGVEWRSLVFSSGELRFASVSLLERDYSGGDIKAMRKPLDFPERHGFDLSALKIRP